MEKDRIYFSSGRDFFEWTCLQEHQIRRLARFYRSNVFEYTHFFLPHRESPLAEPPVCSAGACRVAELAASSFAVELPSDLDPTTIHPIVHHQMDCLRLRVWHRQTDRHPRELEPERSGVAKVKWRPALGSTAQKTLAIPQRSYSLSCRASRPGIAGEAGRTSACSVMGFSSRQTTGCCGS